MTVKIKDYRRKQILAHVTFFFPMLTPLQFQYMEIGRPGVPGLPVVKLAEVVQGFELVCATILHPLMVGNIAKGHYRRPKLVWIATAQVSFQQFNQKSYNTDLVISL